METIAEKTQVRLPELGNHELSLTGTGKVLHMTLDKSDLVRVFVRGGIISPGDFLKIITMAEEMGTDYIHFGSRQDVLFPLHAINKYRLEENFRAIQTDYEINSNVYQNIVSSHVALDVMPRKSWLAPHIYHYIIDSFNYKPRLKINIVDPSQSLVPLFTGELNFIASSIDNYWFLYLRLSDIQPGLWRFPVLILGHDIAKVSQAIENILLNQRPEDCESIYKSVISSVKINVQPPVEDLVYPDTIFPYYEGMNRIPDGKYWLGLYWRNNKFDIAFLKALCERCIETEVGQINLTPWKSFIVKGIHERHSIGWEKLLGRYGINMRHSSLELNWHLPVLDEDSLNLKNYLVRQLDKLDISTYGLTFTVKGTQDMILFTSVVIERNAGPGETYNILYSKDFNPNSLEYFHYAKNVTKEIIPSLLVELSFRYYEQLDERNGHEKQPREVADTKSTVHHQCASCLTIYDETIGDETGGIAPGTPFDALPRTWTCPVCGADKINFRKI